MHRPVYAYFPSRLTHIKIPVISHERHDREYEKPNIDMVICVRHSIAVNQIMMATIKISTLPLGTIGWFLHEVCLKGIRDQDECRFRKNMSSLKHRKSLVLAYPSKNIYDYARIFFNITYLFLTTRISVLKKKNTPLVIEILLFDALYRLQLSPIYLYSWIFFKIHFFQSKYFGHYFL